MRRTPVTFVRTVASSRRCVALLVVSFLTSAAVFAGVDKDSAMYIGGTLSDFPQDVRTSAGRLQVDRINVTGKINTQSESHFVFDAGTKGSISIPYEAITMVVFGRVSPFGRLDAGVPKTVRAFPKDFSSREHSLLTIVYRDRVVKEQAVVLWLGAAAVRPALSRLAARSGEEIQFADSQSCAQYKEREECGYAGRDALKGVRRIFVNTGGDVQKRAAIVKELQKANLPVEIVEKSESADVILNFRASKGAMGAYAGVGTILVARGASRLVSEFGETNSGDDALAAAFAKMFVQEYYTANPAK